MKTMKKILDNKLLMAPLILVLTLSAAMIAFAPSGIKAGPNKDLPFKAVKLCTPKLVQKAIQKIVKGLLSAAVSAIPYIGSALGKLIQKIPDDKIPVPCCCGEFTYDSAPTFMNVKDNPFDFLGTFTIPGIDYAPTQSTQKNLEAKLTKEVVPRWQEAQKQQAAMVKKGSPNGVETFMEAYKIMRTGLANANALALASNFQSEFDTTQVPTVYKGELKKCELLKSFWRDRPATVAENRLIFRELLATMSERGVTVTFVPPPLFIDVLDDKNLDRLQVLKERFYSIATKESAKAGVPIRFLDCTYLYANERRLFLDVVHLNTPGSIEFSKFLNRMLLNGDD